VIFLILLMAAALILAPGTAPAFPDESPESSSLPQGTSLFSSLQAGGTLRGDYFSSDRSRGSGTGFSGATAELKARASMNESFQGNVTARLSDPDLFGRNRTPAEGTLIEGYAALRGERNDVRIGKQIYAWGRADAVNPTDNLTPRDYTVLLPFADDQRQGTASLRWDYQARQDYSLSLFATPFFEPSRFYLPIPAGVAVRDRVPSRTVSHTEGAIKLQHTGMESDWSVSYFRGFSLIPEITLDNAGPSLALRYPLMDVVGADVAMNFGSYGFRAEAAYSMPRDYDDGKTMIQRMFFGVIGADRTFSDQWNINVQVLVKWLPDFHDLVNSVRPEERPLARADAVLFGQERRWSSGITTRAGARFLRDTLETELLVMAWFDRLNGLVRPLLSYAFSDRVKGTVGAEIYSGPADSFWGSYTNKPVFFGEFRYGF
jgi:hypothetical protein